VPYSVIAESGLEADAVSAVLLALERTLGSLGLTNRTDPLARVVAFKLIEFARQGERDPERLCDLARKSIHTAKREDSSTL
jgi:hypothetical protein